MSDMRFLLSLAALAILAAAAPDPTVILAITTVDFPLPTPTPPISPAACLELLECCATAIPLSASVVGPILGVPTPAPTIGPYIGLDCEPVNKLLPIERSDSNGTILCCKEVAGEDIRASLSPRSVRG
ncbi:hypothetical protein CERSUDRAFT_84931 [Gelatoporia subvermispora B]|uniref:Hydrophobin n=1 Tax=Ceriporiopsis subvermispora (strain B) TaxID=914234 RepID=M2PI97_CERS8|nr:hypothetical protein CERSUDRAFT_84931 [Gelatoporia subvermispora B]